MMQSDDRLVVSIEIPRGLLPAQQVAMEGDALNKIGQAIAEHLLQYKGLPVMTCIKRIQCEDVSPRDTMMVKFQAEFSNPKLNPTILALVPRIRRLTWRERLLGKIACMDTIKEGAQRMNKKHKEIPAKYDKNMWEGTFMGWMMKHETLVSIVVSVITTLVTIPLASLLLSKLGLW